LSTKTSRYKTIGGCHCGNISFEMETVCEPCTFCEPCTYFPRACDCDFCSKQGAAYVSDSNGKLVMSVQDETNLSRNKQGSGAADFLLCKKCEVLVAVCYQVQDRLYAAVNSKAVDKGTRFGQEVVVSPRMLGDSAKTERWREIWFSRVRIKMGT